MRATSLPTTWWWPVPIEMQAAPATARGPSVVVAHDFMVTFGGAERITAQIAAAFPEAPVVAIMGTDEVAERMGVADRFTSLINPGRLLQRSYRLLAPAFPTIVDRLRVPEADIVLSSSYAYAHRLRSVSDAKRICYSYSPLRFAWSMSDDYRQHWAHDPVSALAFRALVKAVRISDSRSAQSVDRYLAPGPYVADQISKYYGRDSEIVGAPVDCELFRPSAQPPEDYFLFCGRLIEPYKKVTMLVDAFNQTGRRLVIAGDGPERIRLQRRAKPNVEFVGSLGNEELVSLMQRCQAAVFPSRDDFGLIPIEVMACGRPVLAYAGGGALETVQPGVTGEFFTDQSSGSLREALEEFEPGLVQS